jgi:hypothetical protein
MGKVHYVDCSDGNDSYSGTAPTRAWKTLKKANGAALQPGDGLLLKRGCTWTGPLQASWSGTASQPILISAYGSGALPKIQNAVNNVNVTGSHLIIEYLQTRADPPNIDPNCNNQPYGWTAGFNFTKEASYNTLRYSKASEHAAGVHLNRDTHHNKVLHNQLTNNTVMDTLTPTSVSSTDDRGPWGIVLRGTDNEIAYNYFANNNAKCSYDLVSVGNSVEVFEGQRNIIHHNRSFNDQQFSEVAGTTARRAADNIWAYNLYVGATTRTRFLVVRNAGNPYGPTWRNKAYNNTVYLTGTDSVGIVCHAGCNSDILVMKNNILWAETKAAYADGPFDESNNLYWSSDGDPWVQFDGFSMSPTSRIANPQFVDPATRNFRLKATSPATDAGTLASVNAGFTLDLEQALVPQGLGVDVGVLEYAATSDSTGIITSSGGGSVTTRDGDFSIEFPANAVTSTTTITYTALLATPRLPDSNRIVVRSWTLEACTSGGQLVTQFHQPYRMVLRYTDADLPALGINEGNLNVAYWNGTTWVNMLPCTGCDIDTVNNRMTVVANHFTRFGLIGTGSTAKPDVYLPLVLR